MSHARPSNASPEGSDQSRVLPSSTPSSPSPSRAERIAVDIPVIEEAVWVSCSSSGLRCLGNKRSVVGGERVVAGLPNRPVSTSRRLGTHRRHTAESEERPGYYGGSPIRLRPRTPTSWLCSRLSATTRHVPSDWVEPKTRQALDGDPSVEERQAEAGGTARSPSMTSAAWRSLAWRKWA